MNQNYVSSALPGIPAISFDYAGFAKTYLQNFSDSDAQAGCDSLIRAALDHATRDVTGSVSLSLLKQAMRQEFRTRFPKLVE